MTLLEELKLILPLFNGGKNWIKFAEKKICNGQPCYCLRGAALEVVKCDSISPLSLVQLYYRSPRTGVTWDTLFSTITLFNDSPKTIFQDIENFLTEMIKYFEANPVIPIFHGYRDLDLRKTREENNEIRMAQLEKLQKEAKNAL
jgi:hypothetical protein